MKDVLEVIKNIQNIYESDMAFQVLKDFERVLDDLDLYVYDNWIDGELVSGPKIGKHWVHVPLCGIDKRCQTLWVAKDC